LDRATSLPQSLRGHKNVDLKMSEVMMVEPGRGTAATRDGQSYQGDFLVLAAGSLRDFGEVQEIVRRVWRFHLNALRAGTLVGFCLMAAQLQGQQTLESARQRLTKSQFDQLFRQVSNWRRWGKEDQLGTLNLITAERRRDAAQLVKTGVSVSLARNLNEQSAIDNPTPLLDTMALGVDGVFNMDTYTVNFHGVAFSHFDALSHTYYEGHLYNGYPDAEVTSSGARVLGTAQYRNGIFTRGVLVDIPWLRRLPYLDTNAFITGADLDAWEAKSRVHIHSGDAVLIRTGRWALRDAKGPWDISSASAGLDPSAVVWLRNRDAAFLISDVSHDAIPSAVEGVDWPIHILAIVAMGMPLADQCNLEDIARESQNLHRYTFLLTLAPVRIPGGTGSLVNPIATF
jgi:kynurenine formamidase